MNTTDKLHRATIGWTPTERQSLLAHLEDRAKRKRLVGQYEHPAEIAESVDPDYVRTPMIDVISRSLETAITRPNRNLLISAPPQSGKSVQCTTWAVIRALQHDPDNRIILATYSDNLAAEHNFRTREMIREHGTGAVDSVTGDPVEDKLGLSLDASSHRVGRWRINEGRGGVAAVGTGSGTTGRSADLLIIDDPHADAASADSPAQRRKIIEWYQSVALTRLSPGASVILIATRWSPNDLSGHIIASEQEMDLQDRTWRIMNFPAVAHAGIPDTLGRDPGTPLQSARGRTMEDFDRIRRSVGERTWFALYQGAPSPPEGGLFHREWFDRHRVSHAPARPLATVVGIDPADTGQGDEAGVVAASLTGDGTIVFTHDRSGMFTSDKWASEAVRLAEEIGASEIVFEAYAAPETYRRVLQDKIDAGGATARREGGGASQSTVGGFKLSPWRGKGDAMARSAGLRNDVETGRAVMAGLAMGKAEHYAATWQNGQHQPDRVAAMVIAHDRLRGMGGGASAAAPGGSGGRGPSWLGQRVG